MTPIIRGYQVEESNVIIINKMIKNTYMLLSMTLIFSAFTAYISMILNSQPMGIITLFLYIGLFLITNALRNSIWGIVFVFILTGFLGYTLGPMLNIIFYGLINGGQVIITSLGLTGILFLGLSGYAMISHKNFNFLSGFLFVGLCLTFVASIIGLFSNLPIIHLMISTFFILISAGYILFTTSRIIHGGERNYVIATISLYIQIFNLFVSLLHLLSFFAGRRN
jgi:modulator of FtsH protease